MAKKSKGMEADKVEIRKGPMFNDLHGDFNGKKIIPHEETRHNPISAKSIRVSPQNISLEREVEIGASVKL